MTNFSDHFTNFIGICNSNNKPKTEYRVSRNFSAANIEKFNDDLSKLRWRNVLSSNDVNVIFDNFWSDFYALFILHFPLKKVKLNRNVHKIQNFITNGILTSRRHKNELHKKALLDPPKYHKLFIEYRNMYNKIVRISKQMFVDDNFKKFQKNPKKTWDFLKETTFGHKTNHQINEMEINGKCTKDPKIISENFNNFFSVIGKNISDSVTQTVKKPKDYIPDFNPNKPKFSLDNTGPIHVCDIIKTFDNKSSCDLDGLCLKILKKIAINISVPLAHIFNLSLDKGIFPTNLKTCRIVPVFKAGDPKICDNYRPIALVSTLSKILEKFVSLKLTNHLQINKLLYKHQYGFQKGLSTEHNLLHVVNYISQSLNNGNYCLGIFLDLKKAFDVCSHDILLKKLKKLGIEGSALDWFSSYLLNRKQKVGISGNLSSESIINISVLQGTTLGPILFLCYINDIFTATSLTTFLFADDTSCLAENKCLNDLINYVNTELQKLANWFRANKMAVNISKTKYIIFRTRGKKIDQSTLPSVVLNNNEIGLPNDQSKNF